MTPLPERAIDFAINEAFAPGQRPAGSADKSAALLYHRPQRQRLASFDAKSPFKITGDTRVRVPTAGPRPGRAATVRAYALLQSDPAVLIDGGELLPIGQEDELREVRTILQQLPTSAKVSEIASQPVIVRAYAEPDRVTLLVVNACPWHANADITLDVPQAAALEPLSARTWQTTSSPRRARSRRVSSLGR